MLDRVILPLLSLHMKSVLSIWTVYFCLHEGRTRSKSEGRESNDENISKKDLALQQALDQITSSFGKGSIMWLGRCVSHRQVPVISTGSFALDMALGIGGLPKVLVYSLYTINFLFHLIQLALELCVFLTENVNWICNSCVWYVHSSVIYASWIP